MVKIHELEKLAKRYGYSTSLSQIILNLMEDKPYRCPKCKGTIRFVLV